MKAIHPVSGQVITVFDYYVRVLKDGINLYQEYELFKNSHPNITDKLVGFVECLEAGGLAECIEKGEAVPEEVSDYFSWFFMNRDGTKVPSHLDIEDVITHLAPLGIRELTIREVELLASWRYLEIFSTFSKGEFKDWLKMNVSMDGVDKVVERMGFTWISQTHEESAKERGFGIQSVFSNEPEDTWRTFSYTVSATPRLGYEVILINGSSIGGDILSDVVTSLIEKGGVFDSDPFDLENFGLADGRGIRAKLVEVPSNNPAFNKPNANGGNYTRVVQLLIGDKNNILPGEEGYDEGFVQHFAD